jgi:uncharacterized protein YfaS (alpha-2-macroglobulin family)
MRRLLTFLLLPVIILFFATFRETRADDAAGRAKAKEQFANSNFQVSFDLAKKLALDPADDPFQVGDDLALALNSLRSLGRHEELDALRSEVVALHKENWRLLSAAANSLLADVHYGHVIGNQFTRGQNRGQTAPVNVYQRDHVQMLQWLVQAMPLADRNTKQAEVGRLYLQLADALMNERTGVLGWRLQVATPLDTIPDYEDGWYQNQSGSSAPVAADGKPLVYSIPKDFASATSDGERWRWALEQAVKHDPALISENRMRLAQFALAQFGEGTLAEYSWWFCRTPAKNEDQNQAIFNLASLTENETIAKLATGIKRFELPSDYNYIRILREITADPKSGNRDWAFQTLAEVFQNRRQFVAAEKVWREFIAAKGPGPEGYRQKQLDQITGNWGSFEPILSQPAGKGATVDFRFRNGKKVHFTAKAIKVEAVLNDVKSYLKTRPAQVDWQKVDVSNFGFRLVQQNQRAYVGEKVAEWDLDVVPRPDHADERVTVTTPLQKGGAYLLSAKMDGGSESLIVVWLSDLAIVKKSLGDSHWVYVADSQTGEPVAKVDVELFGWQQKHIKDNQFEVKTIQHAERTNDDGQIILAQNDYPLEYQWFMIARHDGKFAHLGYSHIWYSQPADQRYDQLKAFMISDRPVYRPNQTVKFKWWIARAKYDLAESDIAANQPYTVEIHNPRGEKVLTKKFKTDEAGGFDGELALPKDAVLGVYSVQVVGLGSGTFRVEEYKKPEFEVTVNAPKEPILLGETTAATIRAKYYFGAPVTKAKVKYKVTRTSQTARWYPVCLWDWFYGPGYWWFAYDYDWYPGWHRWGCLRPILWWWPGPQAAPEIVQEGELPLDEKGECELKIDTALAKAIHPDQDHVYHLTAEVTDASRRTIVGSGDVQVAREPFKVYAWLNRGYAQAGETIEASFSARRMDSQPVPGKGVLKLFAVKYTKGDKPEESLVEEWKVDTSEQGQATQKFKAPSAGQYRLSYAVTDSKEHSIEGGYVFSVIGAKVAGGDARFNDLEIIPDKREYAPGDKVKLLINTNHTDATVLLFVRAAQGVYPKPQLLHLKGKSETVELDVATGDMPNFFVEALTVANGRVHNEQREIVVPPQKRVLNIDVLPTATNYKPGAKAEVQLKVTDIDGKPFVGSLVASVYDKSVEYISGGSNVPEIKAFFWKWRRQHSVQQEENLRRSEGSLSWPNRDFMQTIGIFGNLIFDREDGAIDEMSQLSGRAGIPRRAGGMGGGFGLAKSGVHNSRFAMDSAVLGEVENAVVPAAPMALGLAGAFREEAGASPEIEPTVRSNFADTALWLAKITTEADGTAKIALDMPENLTTWKIRCWGMGSGTRVGQGETEVITRKDLIIRAQTPRFLIQKDVATITANVHNYLTTKKQVRVVLELEGLCKVRDFKYASGLAPSSEKTVTIEPNGEARVDFPVICGVGAEGEQVVRIKALTDEESDAMEVRFPCYVHGMLKTESWAGTVRKDQNTAQVTLKVPSERRPEQSQLVVRYSPTLAGALVDALPYLVAHPLHTCDHELDRFLPAVITQRALQKLNVPLKTIAEKRANLNAQQLGDPQERAKAWKRFDENPVFSEDEVRAITKEGVEKLSSMQLSDGGWGWFFGYGEHSSAHITAYVVHGLQIAKQNDVAQLPRVLERGLAWLTGYQADELRMLKNAELKTHPYKTQADELDALVYMVLGDAAQENAEMREFLHRDRVHLSIYTKGMLALALHKQGHKEQRDMLRQNIEQFLVQDAENETAYLRLPENVYWWFWYGDDIEANAYYLKLLSQVDPQNPVAARLVKYLLNNRQHGTHWRSARQTAVSIEALADYLKASGEDQPDVDIELLLDGQSRKKLHIAAADLFTFDDRLVLEKDELTSGKHVLEFRRSGKGPIYWNAYLTNFTLEDPITAAGLEIKVDRKFYKLVPVKKEDTTVGSQGQAVQERVEKFDKILLVTSAEIQSGDMVEVELIIDSKNDYQYLMFEDRKVAGLEPVEVRSGYGGNALGAYMELRDERVTFFVRDLPRGKHSLTYRLRAETPGTFSALPATGSGVYATELKGNSDELKLRIADSPAP